MKFLLMLSEDDEATTRSDAEQRRLLAGHREVAKALRASGRLVDAHRLRPAAEATTIRGPDRVATDGPFAEAKECLGGFYLIDCESRDEAVAWAQRLPLHDGGTIEVRPARTGAQWQQAVRGARKFAVFFVSREASQARRSRADKFREIDDHYGLSLELAAEGRFIGSRALEGTAGSVRLQRTNGTSVVVDGPFAETKEVVLGYFVVACDTKDEAIALGQRLMGGSDATEVRPVWES